MFMPSYPPAPCQLDSWLLKTSFFILNLMLTGLQRRDSAKSAVAICHGGEKYRTISVRLETVLSVE